MKTLLTGRTGQVGSALLDRLREVGEVVPIGRELMDLTQQQTIRDCLNSHRPDVIVNAAAYTAVDRAESEEALATVVNAYAPGVIAAEAAKLGALLIHFSTDYVFDGEKSSPYVETDATAPLNAYGRSKLAGEKAVQASGCRHLIFRTSWVYAASGSNFVLTMLRLARGGKPLRVVDDQVGAPTSNLMIAAAVTEVIKQAVRDVSLKGIFHLTAGGETTWYNFAQSIFRERGIDAQVSAISTSEYRAPARRPRNSMLDNSKLEGQFGVHLPSWEAGMNEILARIPANA